MSKFKVGDRVCVDGTVVAIDESDLPLCVMFDGDEEGNWIGSEVNLRRLVKRKRAKVATPDLVMVAAHFLAQYIGEDPNTDIAKWDAKWLSEAIRASYILADALIAEGKK